MNVVRIKSGIQKVDDLIDGIPKGSGVVIFSNFALLREETLLSFIKINNEKSLVITTKHLPELYKNSVTSMNKNIIFVDAITWRYNRVNPQKQFSKEKYRVNNLTDLNNLLSKITMACKENSDISRIIFDTPSSLLLYSTPGKEQVFRFIELLLAFTRSLGITLLLSIQPNIHDPTVVSIFQFLCDGSISLRYFNNFKQIKINEMIYTNAIIEWIDID